MIALEIQQDFTIQQVSQLLQIERHTATALFENESGVYSLPHRPKRKGENKRARRYRALRIPVAALNRVRARMAVARP